MNQNFEIKGYWFIPEQSNNKIAGTLYFEKHKEIRLELIGGFDSNSLFFDKSITSIQGIGNNAEKITLITCRAYGSQNFSCDFPITNYTCQFIINGKHLMNPDDKTFNRIVVDFSTLYNWLPLNTIRHNFRFSNETEEIDETTFVISKSYYSERVFEIDNIFQLKIFSSTAYNTSFDNRKIEISQNTLCEINCKKKASFYDFLNKVRLFKEFLSLASLSTTNHLQISLYDDNDFQELKNGNKVFQPTKCYFIERDINILNNESHNYLFKYSDIETSFPEIIKQWYFNSNEFAPIRTHLIRSIAFKEVFTSLDFSIVVQALEGYHRRYINNNDKIHLKVRLEEIILIYKDLLESKKLNLDLDKIIKSRNYYSHFYQRTKSVLDGYELFIETEKLRILLISCVLSMIGFDKELINKLIINNNKL